MQSFLLTPQSSCSFRCDDPAIVADWLVSQGYSHGETRSQHEHCRLSKTGSIIVLFHSGAVLVQGKRMEQTVAWLTSEVGGLF